MTNDKLISIIVPVYNVSKYINKCIESIISQTYKNIEIILINDGSTDKSYEICLSYQKIDSRIILLNQKNKGLSESRNRGIKESSGQYIAFIDGDDYIEPDFLQSLIVGMDEYDCDISVCSTYIVEENTNTIIVDPLFKPNKDYLILDNKKALTQLTDNTIPSFSCNKLFKKYLFDNIAFPKNRFFEDVFIMHKVFFLANKIYLNNKPKYYYLKRVNSITGQVTQKYIDDYFYSLFERQLFYREIKASRNSMINYIGIIKVFNNDKKHIPYLNYSDISNTIKDVRKAFNLFELFTIQFLLFCDSCKRGFRYMFSYIYRHTIKRSKSNQ